MHDPNRQISVLRNKLAVLEHDMTDIEILAGVHHAAWSHAYRVHLAEWEDGPEITDFRTRDSKLTYEQLCEEDREAIRKGDKEKNKKCIEINRGAVQLYLHFVREEIEKNHKDLADRLPSQ
jgi:hypothetical protein